MRNDYTEYLMHKDHKYLSKNWVKGKWQYIYDEKLGGKAKRDYEKAKTVNDHDKTLLKVRGNHLRDAVINRSEAKNALSEYSEASKNKFASDSKLKSAKNAYDKTAIGKIDKLKSIGKKLIDKLFSKQNAKKNAAQKSAREEGMAQREKEKLQSQQQSKLASLQRNAEKEQIKTLNSVNKNIREHAYGEAEKQKQDAANKKRINDRATDLINKSHKLEGERFKDQLSYVGAKLNKEKARIATHIKTIMDKTDGDVSEYINKMINDPYSASEEFWEELAENIEKPKFASRRK